MTLRHVVRADGAPVGDAGGAVLVAARVAAIGVALRVADEDGDVGVVDVPVHDHVVALRGEAEVDEVVVVLRVVARNLPRPLELVVEVLAQDELCISAVEVRGCRPLEKSSSTSFVLHAGGVELVQAGADGHLAVRWWAALPPFTMSGMTMTTLAAGVRQLGERRACRWGCGCSRAWRCTGCPSPAAGTRGSVDGLPGDEDVGAVGQLGAEHAVVRTQSPDA